MLGVPDTLFHLISLTAPPEDWERELEGRDVYSISMHPNDTKHIPRAKEIHAALCCGLGGIPFQESRNVLAGYVLLSSRPIAPSLKDVLERFHFKTGKAVSIESTISGSTYPEAKIDPLVTGE